MPVSSTCHPTQRATLVLPARIGVSLCNAPSQPTAFQASSHSTEVEGQTQTRKTRLNDSYVLREQPQLLCCISVCSTVFKYWQKLEKGEKKEPSHKSTFSLCSQDHYLLHRQKFKFFFPSGSLRVFFLNLMRARAVFYAVMVPLSRGNSLWIRHCAAYSRRLSHRRSECVCVCVCVWERERERERESEWVCVFLSEPETLTHCWFCRTELFLKG